MLGPTIALIIIGLSMQFLIGLKHPLYLIIPSLIGISWILVYVVYLIVKSGRYTEYKAEEAK